MKILQRRIQQAAKDGGVSQLVVERDYAQTYVLLGLASQPELYSSLVFKGGTALKKVHFGAYRFSEDLDFSAENGPREAALESAIRAAVSAAQTAARQQAPITSASNVTKSASRIPVDRKHSSCACGFPGSASRWSR